MLAITHSLAETCSLQESFVTKEVKGWFAAGGA